MKKYINSIIISTALGVVGAAADVDCAAISQSLTIKISDDKSKLLEIISAEIAAAPDCSCEIVKAAIKASEADAKVVAAIVEAAISAAPDQMRLITQCAIATAPDAIGEIQAVVSKLDPNAGESVVSAKGAKDAGQEAPAPEWNPLNFPGEGPVGPRPGMDGGNQLLRPRPPFESGPSVDTPVVTDPDPRDRD